MRARILAVAILASPIAACANVSITPPAATVGDVEISVGDLNDALTAGTEAQQEVEETGRRTADDTSAILTALIYRELAGELAPDAGEGLATLAADPFTYVSATLAALGADSDLPAAPSLDGRSVACAAVGFAPDAQSVEDLLAQLPEVTPEVLVQQGLPLVCFLEDDPRLPQEVLDRIFTAPIGEVPDPVPFAAVTTTGFDGQQFEVAAGVALTATVARGPIDGTEVAALGQPPEDLRNEYAAADTAQLLVAGREQLIELAEDHPVHPDPRYGEWVVEGEVPRVERTALTSSPTATSPPGTATP